MGAMGALSPYTNGLLGALAELEKDAALSKHVKKDTRKAWSTSSSRKGRRSMSVGTLLKKEKEGTLGGYKFASQGIAGFADPPVEGGAAKPSKRPGDMPSRDDIEGSIPKEQDGRGSAHTIPTTATIQNDIVSTEKAAMHQFLLKLALAATPEAAMALKKAVTPDSGRAYALARAAVAKPKVTSAPFVGMPMLKAGMAAFFAELEELRPDLLDKIAEADVEEMLKQALNLGSIGGALKGGLSSVGKSVGGALQGARGAVANVAGKVSPTLNKPVMGLAQGAAHKLQASPNSFAQGVGNVLHHKVQTPGKAFLAAANPVGTAAEALTAGAGTAASKGLANVGGKLQAAHGAADAVVREGRAMTPVGRLRNAVGDLGGRMQSSFNKGGLGHNVLTKKLPLAGEIGGAVGAGLALHAPVGLAGVAGKMGLLGAGKLAPAVGTALEHAPHVVDAVAAKLHPALEGAGHVLQHGAEDVIGTAKQNLFSRFGQPAAAAARQSMLPQVPAFH